ncbi:LuxR family two component transcriptional regulator [Promicromonospora sp. AC04]|uniref:response regulator n=1 Tax=Promicromonospora sp. AC04 TaxID=2135723 RepID=UPI000D39ADB7|nr:response regulator transcription factor [Promicromonospora sp. AC04]PUB21475.1 LuxR family two component transcriptional regulator [Promicromonospora sp. AC04]
MTRVLLVDDDPFARSLLATILTRQGIDVVGQVSDGDEVAEAVDLHHPDVVLMDLVMRRVGGIEAISALQRRANPPRIVALTSFAQDEAVHDALRAGAVGFLVKDENPEKIADAVRDAAAGHGALDGAAARIVVDRIVADGRDTRRADAVRRLAALTDRERDVAAWAGELTNDQIAARVHLSASTVKQHLSSALAKLGLNTRAELAVLVDRAGLTAQR